MAETADLETPEQCFRKENTYIKYIYIHFVRKKNKKKKLHPTGYNTTHLFIPEVYNGYKQVLSTTESHN